MNERLWTPSGLAAARGLACTNVYKDGPVASTVAREHRVSLAGGRLAVSVPPMPGTTDLAEKLRIDFNVSVSLRRRKEWGPNDPIDLHCAGRAIDLMTYDDFEKGCMIANHLVENCQLYGVQFVVFSRYRFSCSRSPKFGRYTGPNPHTDHVHVELTPEGARGQR